MRVRALSSNFVKNLRRVALTLVSLAGLVLLAACGGSSSTTTTTSTNTIVLSPATASITTGTTLPLTATLEDSTGTPITPAPTFTWVSSNTSVVDIATSGTLAGLICAGKWDSESAPVVCTPGPVGSATITASATGITSTPLTVSVHGKVDRVVVNNPSATCVSSGLTRQFTAQAFSGGTDITSTIGSFNWSVTDATVVTVDTNGVATASVPGVAAIFATISGVNSLTVPFITCPIRQINVHLPGSTATSFSLTGSAQSQTLQVDAIDTQDNVLAAPPVDFLQTQSLAGSSTGTDIFTSGVPGTTMTLAVCQPPNCNVGLTPVYGNAVTATVTGTGNTTPVYAGSTTGTSIIPVDTSTNSAGTAITLPSIPNSMMMGADGANLFMGSDDGLMIMSTSDNTITQQALAPGKLLAVAPDGSRALVYNASTGNVVVFTVSGGVIELVRAVGATRADCVLDAARCFIVAGSTLAVYQPQATSKTIPLAGVPNDVGFLSQSSMAYLANELPQSTTVRATCDQSLRDTVPASSAPLLLKSLPDASRMLAVTSSGIDSITPTLAPAAGATVCPPGVSDTHTFTTFGIGAFTPRQVLVSNDSAHAIVLSDRSFLLNYNTADASTSILKLNGNATPLAAGFLLDGSQLWVVGSDSALHEITMTNGSDALQVTLPFAANLVAVKPQ